jgi:2-phosphoglycerate kinase
MPPETIVVHKGHGLPYSKGLMAQTISATGLSPGRAFELARKIEQRLDANGGGDIDIAAS